MEKYLIIFQKSNEQFTNNIEWWKHHIGETNSKSKIILIKKYNFTRISWND